MTTQKKGRVTRKQQEKYFKSIGLSKEQSETFFTELRKANKKLSTIKRTKGLYKDKHFNPQSYERIKSISDYNQAMSEIREVRQRDFYRKHQLNFLKDFEARLFRGLGGSVKNWRIIKTAFESMTPEQFNEFFKQHKDISFNAYGSDSSENNRFSGMLYLQLRTLLMNEISDEIATRIWEMEKQGLESELTKEEREFIQEATIKMYAEEEVEL